MHILLYKLYFFKKMQSLSGNTFVVMIRDLFSQVGFIKSEQNHRASGMLLNSDWNDCIEQIKPSRPDPGRR